MVGRENDSSDDDKVVTVMGRMVHDTDNEDHGNLMPGLRRWNLVQHHYWRKTSGRQKRKVRMLWT